MKRYGNNWRNLLVPAAIFATFAFAMLLAFALFRPDRLSIGAEVAAFLFIGPLAFIAPTLIFEILVDEKNITHRAFGRFVLSCKPISDLVEAEFATGGWGAKLKFRDGSAIRFYGAHLGILVELEDHLRRVAPPGARFD